jgi:chaperonin GroES
MKEITPVGERVVLRPVKSEEKTKSGIYLPKAVDKKEGIVYAVGSLKTGQTIPLKQGDRVLYGGYNSEEIEVDGEKYMIVEYKDVIAKFESGGGI